MYKIEIPRLRAAFLEPAANPEYKRFIDQGMIFGQHYDDETKEWRVRTNKCPELNSFAVDYRASEECLSQLENGEINIAIVAADTLATRADRDGTEGSGILKRISFAFNQAGDPFEVAVVTRADLDPELDRQAQLLVGWLDRGYKRVAPKSAFPADDGTKNSSFLFGL